MKCSKLIMDIVKDIISNHLEVSECYDNMFNSISGIYDSELNIGRFEYFYYLFNGIAIKSFTNL